jgi:phosphate-selective porin OprO/OprP
LIDSRGLRAARIKNPSSWIDEILRTGSILRAFIVRSLFVYPSQRQSMNMHFHSAGALLVTGLFGLGTGEGKPASEDPGPGLISLNIADEITTRIFGRLYIDWGWFSGDEPTYFTDDGGTTPELEDGTQFRTARIGVDGTLYEKVYYKLEYDLAPSTDVEAKDVYIALPDTPAGEFRVGHYKEPFSLEQLTSSRFTTFMERSVADAFAPGRNSGFAILNHNEAKTVTWAAGMFRTTDDAAIDFGDGEYSYTARVTGTPWNEEGEDLLHLGGSFSYRGDDMVRFRARPESDFLNRPVDTGTLAADDTMLGGLETAWVNGPLSLQAEYNMASLSGAEGVEDGDFTGWYGFISWFLTGEHRNYKSSSGTFDRIKPQENFGAGTGAIELAARYSMIDLDDGPSTGEMTDATLGVNWYLNPNTRVMFNFIRSEVEDGALEDDANLFMIRFQVDW